MELNIRNLGYYEMTIRACEQDLKDIRQIMYNVSINLDYPVERRAVAHRVVELMLKQREMPK